MLQRAASNAYSWWWASHIRTKQTKWLDQSLQDMEDRVQGMLKLIEEDGDSFAKRAEMYYKRRPELISSVEESYKSFRALADRYDLLSKELQSANHTIATAFPDQVQFMGVGDDSPAPKKPKKKISYLNKTNNVPNVPDVPKAPNKDLKGLLSTASKQIQAKKALKSQKPEKVVQKSGLTKDEAIEEIDKLQKEILSKQTTKEFVKSSYESWLSKYWGHENEIVEMQERVCRLQDEFDVDKVIEDDEARTLMAEAALKSCHETLAQLQEKHERVTKEAMEEYKKVEAARQRLSSFKKEYLHESEDESKVTQETNEIEPLPEEHNELLDLSSMSSLTVTELAEKIDQLVNKVISLESEVSSQTLLISTFRTEADVLNAQIQTLENEKDNLAGDDQNLSKKVRGVEDKLIKIIDLNKNREKQNNNLLTNFSEARSSLDHLSEKISSVKPDEEIDETEKDSSSQYEEENLDLDSDSSNTKHKKDGKKNFNLDSSKTEDHSLDHGSDRSSVSNPDTGSIPGPVPSPVTCHEPDINIGPETVREPDTNIGSTPGSDPPIPKQKVLKKHKRSLETLTSKLNYLLPVDALEESVKHECESIKEEGETERNEDENWQEMLLSGTEEDREKVLLKEYTHVLRNYKQVKKKLSEKEKTERDSLFDVIVQMKELKKGIQKRDEEIQQLRQKLNLGEDVKPKEEDLNVDEKESNKEDESHMNEPTSISIVEEKLRTEIDAILDENLDFWLRFSTSFHQIQKFKTEVQDLQDELAQLREKKKQEGSATTRIKSEVRPIYKHLREIQNELTVWMEQSVLLKGELKRRFASLCNIQEEITKALKDGVEEDEIQFSSHQAAKFQGEILNMKQENNKVRDELDSGLDHVSLLQLEIEKTLRRLNQEFGFCGDQGENNNINGARVPLHSFIFGTKPKKQKNSIFSCMHPNRKYQILKAGVALGHRHS